MALENDAIPVQAILKLVMDKSGGDEVRRYSQEQEESWQRVEGTVSRVGTHLQGIGRSVGELIGVAGVGALVDKFVKIETSASNVALALGKVTGGPGSYTGYGNQLLNTQKHTGVTVAESAAGLQALAASVGSTASPKQAGMLAEMVAGYSLVTGMNPAMISQILGPMLQSAGRGATSSTTAQTMGELRSSLTSFPGSQIGGIAPVVAGLATSAALGGMPIGHAADIRGISGMINSIAGGDSVLRQPGVAEAAAQGIGSTLQGAWRNPQLYGFLKLAGVGYWESQEGFNNPAVIKKIVSAAHSRYPGNSPEAKRKRNELYQELGGGQAGADAYEKLEHSFNRGESLQGHAPNAHREAHERGNAQQRTNPEHLLNRAEGGVLGFLAENPLVAAAGGAGLFGLSKLLKGGAGDLGLGDLAPTIGDLAGGAAGGVLLGLFDTGLGKYTGGTLSGNASGGKRAQDEKIANARAVQAVAQAAQKKFGSGWNTGQGLQWMEHQLNTPGSVYNSMTRAGIGESTTGPHPWAATHLLKQALGAAQQQAGQGGEGETVHTFGLAVQKFSETVDKLLGHNRSTAGYEGGAGAHNAALGAPLAQSLTSMAPGMVMAAFLGGSGGASGSGAGPGGSGAQMAANHTTVTGSSGWEKLLRAYSGNSYGLSYIQKLAAQNTGGGHHTHDRATVEADAKKYGVPFDVLWGIYGAESSFGKAASNFGLTGQFPGSGTSGSFSKDARMAAEDVAKLMKVDVHVHVDGSKAQKHRAKIGTPHAVWS